MASIATDPNGARRIQFFDADHKRKTFRLGKVSKKAAQQVRGYVEDLARAARTRTSLEETTSAWVASLGEVMRERLEGVGLIVRRDKATTWTVAAWIRQYITSKTDATESSICNLRQAEVTVVEYLGADKLLADVTAADAEGYASFLRSRVCKRGSPGRRMADRPMGKANLRTTLYKLMDRAGVTRFGKPFQNMRSTCETNWLGTGTPEYQVSDWIGHKVEVSRRHYDLVRKEYADRIIAGGAQSGAQAAQNPAQQAAAQDRMETQEQPNVLAERALCDTMQPLATQFVTNISPTRI